MILKMDFDIMRILRIVTLIHVSSKSECAIPCTVYGWVISTKTASGDLHSKNSLGTFDV